MGKTKSKFQNCIVSKLLQYLLMPYLIFTLYSLQLEL